MLTFTVSELDTILKHRNPDLGDSTTFAARRTTALKQALADFTKQYIDNDAPYVRRDTFSEGTPPSTGATPKLDTDTGDWFKIALLAGADRVAGDVIYVAIDSGAYVQVPRMKPEDIVPTGLTATVSAFNEVKGAINLYLKDGTVTPPAIVHYYYYTSLSDAALNPESTIDIASEDFALLVDTVFNFVSED